MRALAFAALSLVAVLAAACSRAPPQELDGVWARGSGSCAAGIGVRFEADAVRAVWGPQSAQILLRRPQYNLRRTGDTLHITIRYAIERPRGAQGPRFAEGVLVLARGADGWMVPLAHRIEDRRTGSARSLIGEHDRLASLMRVRSCEGGGWIEGLRGPAGA